MSAAYSDGLRRVIAVCTAIGLTVVIALLIWLAVEVDRTDRLIVERRIEACETLRTETVRSECIRGAKP